MGTSFPNGDKPQNKITISKSSGTTRRVDAESGKADRSFAQPNPNIPPREVDAKAHANVQDELEAINKNSRTGRKHERDDKSGSQGE